MDHWFDTFARAVASPRSRRDALKRIGVAVGAAVAATLPAGALADETSNPPANAQCAEFCNAVEPPGPGRGECKSDAAQDKGLCFACGPAAPAGHPDVCGVGTSAVACCPATAPTCCGNTTCVNLQTDVKNCGKCGTTCGAHQLCCNGACTDITTVQNCGACGVACPAGQGCCNGACADLTTTANCGACGNACGANQACCNGACTDITTAQNCGACGIVCPGAQQCIGGKCACPAITCSGGQILNPTTCTCECPSGTAFCSATGACVSSTCPPNSGQTYNPSTCACECPSGEALNSSGVCASCGTSFVCGAALTTCGTPAPGGVCVCLQSVEGFTACGENFTCGSTATCTSSAQCVQQFGLGSFCQAPGTGCCGAGVCVPACGTPGFLAMPAPSGTTPRTNAG